MMETPDTELGLELEDFIEFEQRGRSHTWPAQQFVHPGIDDAMGKVTPCFTPDLNRSAEVMGSNATLSTSSNTSLAQALQSNLSLAPEVETNQEMQGSFVHQKQTPIRAGSEIQVSISAENVKSNTAASYPSLSQLLAQKPGQPTVDISPALPQHIQTHSKLALQSPPPESLSAIPQANFTVNHQTVLASGSGQSAILNLIPGTGKNVVQHYNASDLATSSSAQKICDGSGEILEVVPAVDRRTASNLSLTATATTSLIQTLPTSNLLRSTATSPSVRNNNTDSYTARSTVSYFGAPSVANELVDEDPEDPGEEKPVKKKRVRKRPNGLISQKKPNPWGDESYSDLIAKALESTVDGRMRLNEIYNWFATNVPYFASRTSPEESAGWKNSIRHNLSLHSRFMRIQNEGAGKSSWWVINPDAKPGRNPRRQRSATLETSTKATLDKKRRGARKKVMEMRAGGGNGGSSLHSATSSIVSSQASVLSRELYADNDESLTFEPFRPRAQSNLSLSGSSSRVSPSVMDNYENFESFDFPPFVEASVMPHDILDRTNEMNLNQTDSPAFHRPMANPMLNGTSTPASSNLITHIKAEPSSSGRTENGVQPPPSYHELNVVRGVQNIQNPLLRTHLIQNRVPNQPGISYNGTYSTGSSTVGISNWMQSNMSPPGIHPSISCAAQQQSFSGNTTAALPMDLENLALPDQPLMEVENMEAVIRHELSQSTGSQLSFDNI